MSDSDEVEVTLEGPNKISITFPKGTKAAVAKRAKLADVLKALGGQETGDVEGQSGEGEVVVGPPGSG